VQLVELAESSQLDTLEADIDGVTTRTRPLRAESTHLGFNGAVPYSPILAVFAHDRTATASHAVVMLKVGRGTLCCETGFASFL
jgi:hypothetical protein